MKKAILGKKLGMSQIFAADGTVIPVTVVEAGPCTVVQIKNVAKDGYDAVKVAYGDVKANNVNKPTLGQYKKANVAPKKTMKEVRFEDCSAYTVGQEIKADVFVVGDKVDVTGTTRGRGYTGTIQRWNTHRLMATHGVGPVHRCVGSLGANSSPSRVFKNKKMAGQYGHEQVTIQNLEVVKVDAARNVLLIAGGIPGPKNSPVIIKNTCKKVKPSKWFK